MGIDKKLEHVDFIVGIKLQEDVQKRTVAIPVRQSILNLKSGSSATLYIAKVFFL